MSLGKEWPSNSSIDPTDNFPLSPNSFLISLLFAITAIIGAYTGFYLTRYYGISLAQVNALISPSTNELEQILDKSEGLMFVNPSVETNPHLPKQLPSTDDHSDPELTEPLNTEELAVDSPNSELAPSAQVEIPTVNPLDLNPEPINPESPLEVNPENVNPDNHIPIAEPNYDQLRETPIYEDNLTLTPLSPSTYDKLQLHQDYLAPLAPVVPEALLDNYTESDRNFDAPINELPSIPPVSAEPIVPSKPQTVKIPEVAPIPEIPEPIENPIEPVTPLENINPWENTENAPLPEISNSESLPINEIETTPELLNQGSNQPPQ